MSLEKEEMEKAIKEGIKLGIKEWLDETYVTVGKWTVGGLAALIVASVLGFIFFVKGIK